MGVSATTAAGPSDKAKYHRGDILADRVSWQVLAHPAARPWGWREFVRSHVQEERQANVGEEAQCGQDGKMGRRD